MRQRMSVPANFQIASREASTATKMQRLVIQNETLLTSEGLRYPRRDRRSCESDKIVFPRLAVVRLLAGEMILDKKRNNEKTRGANAKTTS